MPIRKEKTFPYIHQQIIAIRSVQEMRERAVCAVLFESIPRFASGCAIKCSRCASNSCYTQLVPASSREGHQLFLIQVAAVSPFIPFTPSWPLTPLVARTSVCCCTTSSRRCDSGSWLSSASFWANLVLSAAVMSSKSGFSPPCSA